MDTEAKFLVAVVAIIGLIFGGLFAGVMHSDSLNSQNARICMQHGMQWVDNNCIKVSK